MRPTRVWKKLLGLSRVVVEAVDFAEEGDTLVVSLRSKARERKRCPHCRRRCPGYDWGEGRRRWRALDLGTTFCFLEGEARVVARPRHRRDDHPVLRHAIRISSATVGWICARVTAEATAARDLLGGLRRIGIAGPCVPRSRRSASRRQRNRPRRRASSAPTAVFEVLTASQAA